MKDIYPEYYGYPNDDIKNLWEDSIVVFDANVLLDFYKYTPKLLDDLMEQLKIIIDKLWMPYQVGLELQRNRLKLIYEQLENIEKQKRALIELKPTKDKFFNFQNKTNPIKADYLSIDIDKLINDVSPIFDTLITQIEDEYKKYSEMLVNDRILTLFELLYENRVQVFPYSKEALAILTENAKRRFSIGIPPGFKDQEKDDFEFFGDVKLEARYGDFFIWESLIEKSISSRKNIIFITNEEKEDWIRFVSKKKVGARPELVREFKLRTEGKVFMMYNATEFFKLAREYFKFNIENTELDEVQKVIDSVEAIFDDYSNWAISEQLPSSTSTDMERMNAVHQFTQIYTNSTRRPISSNWQSYSNDYDLMHSITKYLQKTGAVDHADNIKIIDRERGFFKNPFDDHYFSICCLPVKKLNLQSIYTIISLAKNRIYGISPKKFFIFIDIGNLEIDLSFMKGFATVHLTGDVILCIVRLQLISFDEYDIKLVDSFSL